MDRSDGVEASESGGEAAVARYLHHKGIEKGTAQWNAMMHSAAVRRLALESFGAGAV